MDQCKQKPSLTPQTAALGVPEILEGMAKTFRDRNAVYGDNWRMVGQLMAVMFPNGVVLKDAQDYDVWHLFELQIVKLSRFAISGRTHIDSQHDMSVYGAMIEAILKQQQESKQ
jgi:hypothetical protein